MISKWMNPLFDCERFEDHYSLSDYDVNVIGRFSPSMVNYIKTSSKYIDIPKEILEFYELYRRTPLRRIKAWEEYLGTKNNIFIKDETDNALGSYKMNTAIAHAYFAKLDNYKGVVGETLAGHWGLALAFACSRMGIGCKIVVHKDYFDSKENYIHLIENLGAEVIKCNIDGDPLVTSRTLALHIAEENDWAYAVGCSFPHVLCHQSVVGLELLEQASEQNLEINNVIACCGSGSNLGGIALPVIEKYKECGKKINVFAGIRSRSENESIIEAKGLTGHNFSKVILDRINKKEIKLVEVTVSEARTAVREFFQIEGYLLAPETGYAIATVKKLIAGSFIPKNENIIINLSGRAYWEKH